MCSDGFVSLCYWLDTEIDQNGESMVRRSSVACPISCSTSWHGQSWLQLLISGLQTIQPDVFSALNHIYLKRFAGLSEHPRVLNTRASREVSGSEELTTTTTVRNRFQGSSSVFFRDTHTQQCCLFHWSTQLQWEGDPVWQDNTWNVHSNARSNT